MSVPAEKQLLDGVTGIWWSQKLGGNWTEPERVVLNNDVSLDGCECVNSDTMWFCSVRRGNLGAKVNSTADEGWPFLSSDGNELWFCGQSRLGYVGPAIFRSLKTEDGSCGEPEEIISNFVGEPTLDDAGNIYYYTHHFFSQNGVMLEADIYVAYRNCRRRTGHATDSYTGFLIAT